MAPEINEQQPYEGDKVDLYSAGVVLFTMLYQNPPFAESNREDQMFVTFSDPENAHKFWQAHRNSLWKKGQKISRSFQELFHQVCAWNPLHRATAEQIKGSRWFNEYTATLQEVSEEVRLK